MFLTQQKHVYCLSVNFTHILKYVCILCIFGTSLALTYGEFLADVFEYKSMVGALQCLTMMRAYIAYYIHMYAPHTTHLHDVRCIFQYMYGTLRYSLWIHPATLPSLIVAYFNAD